QWTEDTISNREATCKITSVGKEAIGREEVDCPFFSPSSLSSSFSTSAGMSGKFDWGSTRAPFALRLRLSAREDDFDDFEDDLEGWRGRVEECEGLEGNCWDETSSSEAAMFPWNCS